MTRFNVHVLRRKEQIQHQCRQRDIEAVKDKIARAYPDGAYSVIQITKEQGGIADREPPRILSGSPKKHRQRQAEPAQ